MDSKKNVPLKNEKNIQLFIDYNYISLKYIHVTFCKDSFIKELNSYLCNVYRILHQKNQIANLLYKIAARSGRVFSYFSYYTTAL